MESVSYAINSANAIKSFVHSELGRSDNRVQNEEQARESEDMKKKARKAITLLRNSISLVDGTLAKLNETQSRQSHDADREPFSDLTAPIPSTLKGLVSRSQKIEDAKSLVKAITGMGTSDNLHSQSQTIQSMAKAIKPIINNFDSVLSKPYLDQFSATLNTVPVVGLKNNQIMYLATKPGSSEPKQEWEFFSKLPAPVPSNAKVHLFPFKGHFYISIGTAVWKKECRSQGDEMLKQAVDNWPKMYKDEWEKIGDTVLPAGNLRSVVPFVELSPDGTALLSHLLLLRQENKVSILTKDDIYDKNEWAELTSKSGVRQWARMSYWNGQILSLDNERQLWNVKVDVKTKTYTVSKDSASPKPLDPTTEFTATELGPVIVRSDGYLYKRFVEDVSDPSGEPVLPWTPWVQQQGVTNLGVASPGVLMNLKLLTSTLKTRYIETQTALYPMLSKLRTFSKTNGNWLKLLEDAAKQYDQATTEEKEKIALEQGKMTLNHAKAWSKVLSKASSNSKDTVNIMSRQTKGISQELRTQLAKLREELRKLEIILESEKEQLSVLQACFWASIGAMLLGILLAIVTLVTAGMAAPALIGAGALFALGFGATIGLAVKISQLAAQIAKTESQIATTNAAISSLTDIINRFVNLDETYGVINTFWGRLNTYSNSIGTNLDVVASGLEDLLFLQVDIITARKTNDELADAAQLYLDVLHAQGIKLPQTAQRHEDGARSFASENFFPPPSYYDAVFDIEVKKAEQALTRKRPADYERHMANALESQGLRDLAETFVETRAGVWYDIAALSKTCSIFEGNPSRLLDIGIILAIHTDVLRREYVDIKNKSRDVGRAVASMVIDIVSLAKDIQQLLQEYKQLKKAGKWSEIKKLKGKNLDTILATCKRAMRNAAVANNSFLGVNRLASDYDLRVQTRQNARHADINAARASADQKKQNITIPWQVAVGGWRLIEAYKSEKRREIEDAYRAEVKAITYDLDILQSLRSSGYTFREQSLTWTRMVQKVNGSLGAVYHALEAAYDMVDVDPRAYEKLLETEWKTIREQSEIVLSILEGQGVSPVGRIRIVRQLTGGRQEMLVQALCPSVNLGPTITKQSTDTKLFFDQMDALLALPYLDCFVGYWDEDASEKSTLLDVMIDIRGQYMEMMAREYRPIETLYSLAQLQKGRAEWVVKGNLSLEKFVKASQNTVIVAQNAAKETADEFRNSADNYQALLRQIDKNLAEIKKNIKQLDVDIEKASQGLRNKIIWVIADTIALCLATAALLAGLGAFGPVTASLALATKLGLGAAATAAGIKGVIDSLELADIAALMARLRSSRFDLDESRKSLETVKPLFANVVQGVKSMETATTDMAELLANLANDVRALEGLGLSEADAEKIGAAWATITDETLRWMDIINAQGIRSY